MFSNSFKKRRAAADQLEMGLDEQKSLEFQQSTGMIWPMRDSLQERIHSVDFPQALLIDTTCTVMKV